MNVERIRLRLKGGFKPFCVVTSSGDKYPVPHPEFIFLTQRVVIIADRRGYTVNLDPLHIVALQEITGRGSNNRRRAKR